MSLLGLCILVVILLVIILRKLAEEWLHVPLQQISAMSRSWSSSMLSSLSDAAGTAHSDCHVFTASSSTSPVQSYADVIISHLSISPDDVILLQPIKRRHT